MATVELKTLGPIFRYWICAGVNDRFYSILAKNYNFLIEILFAISRYFKKKIVFFDKVLYLFFWEVLF